MNQEKIGKFIAECRKSKKITQSELAEKLGVTDRSVSNWENGKNMPDISLFKQLCDELDITINDLMSGEKIKEEMYQKKFEENVLNTIEYTNKKLDKSYNKTGVILLTLGILIILTAITIFPSESSWSSIYSAIGVIISLIGFSYFTRKFKFKKRVFLNYGFFMLAFAFLLLLDFINIKLNNEAPMFSINKISSETIVYYDTPFYDVVRCNRDSKDEYYKIINNQVYDVDNIDKFENICK